MWQKQSLGFFIFILSCRGVRFFVIIEIEIFKREICQYAQRFFRNNLPEGRVGKFSFITTRKELKI
jgi:hypothetical protein